MEAADGLSLTHSSSAQFLVQPLLSDHYVSVEPHNIAIVT